MTATGAVLWGAQTRPVWPRTPRRRPITMGRPLNSKYFNPVPTSNGESVASITITNAGTYTTLPTVSISAPNLPNGTSATLGTVHMKAVSATVATSGTGDVSADYVPGNILTVVGGTGTAATFTVASVKIRTVGLVGDGGGFVDGNTVTFSTGWATPAVLTLTVADGVITAVTVTNAGVRSTALPTDPVQPDSTDGPGTLAGTTFNLGFGVNAVTVNAIGDYTVISANPRTTTTNSANGTGATLTVTYGVLSVPVTNAGDGYVNAADAAVTFSAGAAAATAVLTAAGTNVILAHAFVVDGTQTLDADVIKQTSTNEYLMETTEGSSICTLVASNSLVAGQAYIQATDALDSTYFVTKLTAHLAVLETDTDGGTGFVYASGDAAPWSLEATSLDPSGLTVQIESA